MAAGDMPAALSRQPGIERPEGGAWRLYSGGLYMRADDGEAGKLARLADVRNWLMHEHEWPMERAADEIIAGLHKANASGLELFIASSKSHARPLQPDSHMLGCDEVADRGGLRGLDERVLGFSGVCNAITNGWLGEWRGYTEGDARRIDAVCVRAAVALELWGWGTATAAAQASPFPNWPALVAYRKANPRSSWDSGNQIDIAKAERAQRVDARQPKTHAIAEMANELGVTRQALGKTLNRERKRSAPKTAPAVTIVKDGSVTSRPPKPRHGLKNGLAGAIEAQPPALHPPSQLHRCAQHVVDARLPAVPRGAQRGQHVGIKAQLHRLLGAGLGAAHRAASLARRDLLGRGDAGMDAGMGFLQALFNVAHELRRVGIHAAGCGGTGDCLRHRIAP